MRTNFNDEYKTKLEGFKLAVCKEVEMSNLALPLENRPESRAPTEGGPVRCRSPALRAIERERDLVGRQPF